MKKDFNKESIPGQLLTPLNTKVSSNEGALMISGWKRRNDPNSNKLRIRLGKRVIDQNLDEVGECINTRYKHSEYDLFQFQVKIGKGLKKLHFSFVGENKKETHLRSCYIWQKDQIESISPKQDEPEVVEKSEYEQWLTEHEPKLRSINFETFPSKPNQKASVLWVVELEKCDESLLKKTLCALLSQPLNNSKILLLNGSATEISKPSLKRLQSYTTIPGVHYCQHQSLTEFAAHSECDWISFLKEGDTICNDLLTDFSKLISTHPQTKVFYTDFDSETESYQKSNPTFLPAWNRDLQRSYPYISSSFIIRTSEYIDAGGLGLEANYSRWNLLLKITQKCKRQEIQRLCGVYFHLHATDQQVDWETLATEGKQLLEQHLERIGEAGQVIPISENHTWRIQYQIPVKENQYPKVSLLIPTRDGVEVLATCVDSILEKTTYPNFEILILDNDSEKEETLNYFKKIEKSGCKIISCSGKFNYSAINNKGAASADGILLGFLNNDLEVTEGNWLHELVAHAMRPNTGAVGPKLLYPDGTLQHAGVLLGVGHVAAHAFRLFENDISNGPIRAHAIQNYSAVTAACLLVRKETFHQVGGFDEKDLAITNNDVDLCIKIREAGYRNLFTPFATLFHHESATRGPEDTPEKKIRYSKEVDHMWKTWPELLINDPAYNRLLTRFKEDFSPAHINELEAYKPGKIF